MDSRDDNQKSWRGTSHTWEEKCVPSLNRLKNLITSRFSRDLVYQGPELRHLGERVHPNDEDFVIPLKSPANYWGQAIIKEGANLSEDQKTQASELIELILLPTLEAWNRLEALARQESPAHAQLDLNSEDVPSNVIDLKKRRMNLSELTIAPEESEERKVVLSTSLIYLESKVSTRIFRKSLDIHEFTKRWAFLSWKDVESRMNSLEDFENLGSVTLFIPRLEEVSEKQVNLINQYIALDPSPEMPLLLVSSTDLHGVEESLQAVCDRFHIQLDRLPLLNVQISELIDLLFRKTSPDGALS